jgi:branched-chain amino acid transport system permease protein
VSIALAMLFQEVLLLIFGGNYRSTPTFITGFLEIAGVRVSYQHFIAIGTCLIILLGVWLLLKTRLGNVIKAVAQDREVSNLMGINPDRICILIMAISVIIAGIASVVIGPIFMVHPLMWMNTLVVVMAAAVLGGLGSIKGSVIAALILGFTEVVIVNLIPGGSFLRGAGSLCVMIAVLIVKPEGLFGIIFEEERL